MVRKEGAIAEKVVPNNRETLGHDLHVYILEDFHLSCLYYLLQH
jgi:hypothetical protein